MTLNSITLDDKYTQNTGRVFVSGTQALVRLALVQRRRDTQAGLNTAGFISGYRGSPMTAMDVELWRAEKLLEEHHIKFWPGTNENLAMTSVWGTQQVGFFNDANYDGVFSMWYGKGPGLDQSMDALREGNYHGSAKHGGVLILAGDDPAMRSTVVASHSELLFEDLLMPVLYPADIQEVFDLGFYGIAMSRFSGAWVGYKLLPETIENSASINGDSSRINIKYPEFAFPADGVNARAGDSWTLQEGRIKNFRLPAALAFARANQLNRVSHASNKPRFGIAAMGKTWRDVLQALHDLGLDEQEIAELGITILKIAMPFPADDQLYKAFAEGLEEVLVVEDKREQIENGIKRACYSLSDAQRPRVVGRKNEHGQPLISNIGDLDSDSISRVIAQRVAHFYSDDSITARLNTLKSSNELISSQKPLNISRIPYFCSGCPHNTSTKVPEGSKAFGGVGCHFMANWMDRDVFLWTHMGGEGAQWIGQAPFVSSKHAFQQLGDGTYYHSGSIAIRAAVAANINITYKILFNDAVAMTGGQPVDGELTVPMITHQVDQEGVRRIAVVSDEPEKYDSNYQFAKGTTIHHRKELDKVQREMRDIEGVTVIIYDQTCAAEKRRRRKRGTFPDPAKRLFINDRVCEGCGDCSVQSNCLSIQPVDTEYGRKRTIHQSSCNKDYSCVNGFCPSFVTVKGGQLRKGVGVETVGQVEQNIPDPELITINHGETYNILITGVGGTGVVTFGALVGMAAHIEEKGVSIVDQLGFSQKGGPVYTHIRLANRPADINTARINTAATDLLMGTDMLGAGVDKMLPAYKKQQTRGVVNLEQNMSADFVKNTNIRYPSNTLQKRLNNSIGSEQVDYIQATKEATALLGDAIYTNMYMLGYAWQKGLLPLGKESILKAIELNGVKTVENQEAFYWGRLAARDPAKVEQAIAQKRAPKAVAPKTLAEIIEHRYKDLLEYQNTAYADQYKTFVNKVEQVEKESTGEQNLSKAVAKNLYKLMAYKDEYEVARLYANPEFKAKLAEQFEGDYKLEFNLAPPLLTRKDKLTGRQAKMSFGAWLLPVFGVLAKFKFLRNTAFDIFGYSKERKMERNLIVEYKAMIETLMLSLSEQNISQAIELANLPDQIRGYGMLKEASVEKYEIEKSKLISEFKSPAVAKQAV